MGRGAAGRAAARTRLQKKLTELQVGVVALPGGFMVGDGDNFSMGYGGEEDGSMDGDEDDNGAPEDHLPEDGLLAHVGLHVQLPLQHGEVEQNLSCAQKVVIAISTQSEILLMALLN